MRPNITIFLLYDLYNNYSSRLGRYYTIKKTLRQKLKHSGYFVILIIYPFVNQLYTYQRFSKLPIRIGSNGWKDSIKAFPSSCAMIELFLFSVSPAWCSNISTKIYWCPRTSWVASTRDKKVLGGNPFIDPLLPLLLPMYIIRALTVVLKYPYYNLRLNMMRPTSFSSLKILPKQSYHPQNFALHQA